MTLRAETAPDVLHIVVAGDIAAGKTTTTQALSDALGVGAWFEQPEHNPFLERYYASPQRWALVSQLWFTLETAAQHRAIHRGSGAVQDHSVYENVYVFGAMMAERGVLPTDEWTLLQAVGETLVRELPPPSGVVLLQTPPDELLRRIAARGRPYEQEITTGYLEALADTRRQYFADWALAPVIPVDTTRQDPRVPSHARAIAERVECTLRAAGRWPSSMLPSGTD